MLDIILTIFSFPFWFIAFMFAIVGIFGTVKVNGVPYRGKYFLLIKAGVVCIGLIFGAIAYMMITIV